MKKKIKFFASSFLFFAIFSFAAFTQNYSWRVLQTAEQKFYENDFSSSMRFAQDAISLRQKEVEHINQVLTNELTPYQVRKVGDSIVDVMKVLDERQSYEAYNIIKSILEKNGLDFFKNSISSLVEYVNKKKDYPEAYFLIAKIYKLEGEYDLSLSYLEKARNFSFLLEVPAQLTDILYEIAEIARYKNDVNLEESALLLIAQNAGSFRDKTLQNAMIRTSRAIKDDNSSKFFSLYRIDAVKTVNAYFYLSSIYDKNKKFSDAYLTNLFGVLICFTHINSILEERDSDYNFESLSQFFVELSCYDDIMEWCDKIGFWRGMNNIYILGRKNNFVRFPKDILSVMKDFCPDEYWKKFATEILKSEK